MPDLKTGVELIANEQLKNIYRGYDAAHDDLHVKQELARAAMAYLFYVINTTGHDESEYADDARHGAVASHWPFRDHFNPSSDPIENLVSAGNLVASEIDRRVRERERNKIPLPGRDLIGPVATLERRMEEVVSNIKLLVESQSQINSRLHAIWLEKICTINTTVRPSPYDSSTGPLVTPKEARND